MNSSSRFESFLKANPHIDQTAARREFARQVSVIKDERHRYNKHMVFGLITSVVCIVVVVSAFYLIGWT